MTKSKTINVSAIDVGLEPSKCEGYLISREKNGAHITFARGLAFKHMLTNPNVIIDGRTIGQANRDTLIQHLQEWIDEGIKA